MGPQTKLQQSPGGGTVASSPRWWDMPLDLLALIMGGNLARLLSI
jgi:hypothetical protein